MPARDAQSPARRPQVTERSSSSQSLSRGSPTTGNLSNSHKGSSHKLHKAHPVGHGRHTHGRVPSYGKGLHKLSKLGPGVTTEGAGHVKTHTRSASLTPSTSPTTSTFKRSSSNLSLPRVGSKASIKKSASHVSLTRNGSTVKVGNQAKSEKGQTKVNLRKKGTDDAPLKGIAKFEVGEELQDEDWTEDSSSQSPVTTRQNSANPSRPKTPQSRDSPSPHDSRNSSPVRSATSLSNSPPENSALGRQAAESRADANGGAHRKGSSYVYLPDVEAVTNRLLKRHGPHTPAPQTSNISASITPPVAVGSPAFTPSSASTLSKEPSMPADGISRFLTTTSSNPNSATPSSISHLQAHLDRTNRQRHHRPSSPTPASPSRRVKSATNLTHSRLSNGHSTVATPPSNPKPQSKPQPSAFESARAADPTAGKSFTQLKLDLQRKSTQRDTPTSNPPLMYQGSMLNMAGHLGIASGRGVDVHAMVTRQYEIARKELATNKRFWPEIVVGRVRERGLSSKREGESNRGERIKDVNVKTPVGSSGDTKVQRRGRVRFEVGGRSLEDERGGEGESGSGEEEDGVAGLLRRMWVGGDSGLGGG